MTGLLPDAVREVVGSRSTFSASESFGVVTLGVLVVLLIQWQVLQVMRPSRGRYLVLSSFSVPLLVAVGLTIAARIEVLLG
jgi:hypothetical protein